MAHPHPSPKNSRVLLFSIFITVAFVILEATAGHIGKSLSLVSDAGHNVSDAFALILSFLAIRIAGRPSTSARTFGYHRATIFAALLNAVSLILIALYIFWEAYKRFQDPVSSNGALMIGVAVVAIVLNGLIALWLRSGHTHDLNIRAAYIHMLGDMFSAFGVVLAGVFVHFTGSMLADPVVSVLIGLFILWSSWGILREAVDILLEATPYGIDMQKVEKSICAVQGVRAVHDLHVWTISSNLIAASCHITVSEQSISDGQQVMRAVVDELKKSFNITHSTIQVEVEGCEPNDMYCVVKGGDENSHAHTH